MVLSDNETETLSHRKKNTVGGASGGGFFGKFFEIERKKSLKGDNDAQTGLENSKKLMFAGIKSVNNRVAPMS